MGLAQRRQERLEHTQLADDVDVELTGQLLRRQELERCRDGDAGVVDEPVEPLDLRRGVGDSLGLGDVEDELERPLRRLAGAPHRRVDGPAAVPQPPGDRLADPGRRPGYESDS